MNIRTKSKQSMVQRKPPTFNFVIEVCRNCNDHQTFTRHNESVYTQVFSDVSMAISNEIPATCEMNRVPSFWAEKETYSRQVIFQKGASEFDLKPRLGAFEISTVWDNEDILFFSKKLSLCWPSPWAVA